MEELTRADHERGTYVASPVVLSALWAAWGDALGFPFEMTQPKEAQAQLQSDLASETSPWTRRVGGRFGAQVPLPAGTYSDDTQLRLAVSRCLRGNGRFDAEAFSKIELPVFLSYALGAGRGTKRAAKALTNRSVRWNTNFFSDGELNYVNGGGNGAAMRIQPHIWAAPHFGRDHYLPGLLRDAVTTHGHPTGIVGALLHAFTLEFALANRALPNPSEWQDIAADLPGCLQLFFHDDRLGPQWMQRWETVAGASFEAEWLRISQECAAMLTEAHELLNASGSLAIRYSELVGQLGGFEKRTRGSGVVTAVLALWLAVAGQLEPVRAIQVSASVRGSDTDTIATMAGALLGTVADDGPPGELQDRDYIVGDARWLDSLREGKVVRDFPHPDPLHWKPPATLVDALGRGPRGQEGVAGLGPCRPHSQTFPSGGKDSAVWQWVQLDLGQTLLIKRREELAPLPDSALPRARNTSAGSSDNQVSEPELAVAEPAAPPPAQSLPDSVDDAVELARRHNFDALLVGLLVEHMGGLDDGATKAGIFAALVTRARQN